MLISRKNVEGHALGSSGIVMVISKGLKASKAPLQTKVSKYVCGDT